MKIEDNNADVTVEELMREEHSSKRTAQNDMAKMRKRAGKEKGMPVPLEDYMAERGYTREQALRALGRKPDPIAGKAA